MIAPSSRLLLVASATILPLATVAGLSPVTAVVSAVGIAIVVLVVVIDAVLALGRLDLFQATLPELVRLTKDREGAIRIQVMNETERAIAVRLGLPLPISFSSAEETVRAELPSGASTVAADWPCTPTRRGRYEISEIVLEVPSPLDFWGARRRCPASCEVRVYPNLFDDRRRLAALFLNRGYLGMHAQRQVGRGREFEKLREYMPGDSYDEIHWKTTAKRGHPVTKVFQIERTQEVYVVVDASRLSARAPVPREEVSVPVMTHLERYLTASLVLGLAAEQQNDHFGVLAFGDRIKRFIRAGSGKGHYSACRDALYTLEPERVAPDFDELFSFLRLRLRRRALLVFLTGLDDPVLAESFLRNTELICRRHVMLVNMIQPPGVHPLFSREAGSTRDIFRHLAGHLQWNELHELDRALHRRGVRFSLLNNERLCVELVSQYVNVKQRQIL